VKTVQSIGRYRVDGLLGTGAMGEVYRAYDPVIDRPVAIKIVRTELAAGSGSIPTSLPFSTLAKMKGCLSSPWNMSMGAVSMPSSRQRGRSILPAVSP
jgi:serine/threonine-protein kinase